MTIAVDRQIEAEVQKEIESLRKTSGVRRIVEPKCRVCQHETSRELVNKMLANGVSYAEIADMVELAINPTRAKNAKINYAGIWHHSKYHFNLEEPAKAAYRRMLERRQAELEIKVQGVAHLITAMGYLDVMVQKGYETLIAEDSHVSAELGMEAAIKLHNLTQKQAGAQEIAELKQQLNIALSAVKDVVPEQYWTEIVARLEDAEVKAGTNVIDAEVIDDEYGDDSSEAWAPPVEGDIDDSLED